MSGKKTEALSPLIEDHQESWLQRAIERIRTASRHRRSALFHAQFAITRDTRILDLGGWDGTYIHSLLADSAAIPGNVYVADIDPDAVRSAAERFGFVPMLIEEGGRLPYDDNYFDIVFCSSVLEHVTIPKAQIWQELSGRRFRRRARQQQQQFAAELQRVAKGYFVQVPNRWFPIEMHTWLPFVGYLPRLLQCHVINISNRIWIKKTDPDFYLPSSADLFRYFPQATLHKERIFGLTKSLIAVRGTHGN